MRVDGANGRAAIFTVDSANPSDDAPLNDRLNHASRLRMHTDAPHIGVVGMLSGSVTIAQNAMTTTPIVATLAAHGQPYTPSVLVNFSATQHDGVVRSGPLIGSQPFTVWPEAGKSAFLSCGCDATNIFLNIYPSDVSLQSTSTTYGNWAFTVDWSAMILDIGFDSSGAVVPKGSGNVLFHVNSGGYITASGGAFDTRRRYIYDDPSGAFQLPTGRSLDVWIGKQYATNGSSGRYACRVISPTFGVLGNYYAHPDGLLTSSVVQYTSANITPVTTRRVSS